MPTYFYVPFIEELPAQAGRYPQRSFRLPTGRTVALPSPHVAVSGCRLVLPGWLAQREGLREDTGLARRAQPMFKLPYDAQHQDTPRSYQFTFYDHAPLWLPKAHVVLHEADRYVLMPGWLAAKRGICQRCVKLEPAEIPQDMAMPE